MQIKSCLPVIPSADLTKSLHFWVDALGLTADRHMYREGKLIGCMVHNEHVWFWLNERGGASASPEEFEGIRLYWAPDNIYEAREKLKQHGFDASEIIDREFGQTEFVVTDHDGHFHCFGVATPAKKS